MRYLCGEHVTGVVLNRPVGLDVRYCLLLSGKGRKGKGREGRDEIVERGR